MNEPSRVPRVTQIAPQLPPAIDGVGDYCHNLWEHWPQPRPDWRFLACIAIQPARKQWAGTRLAGIQQSAEGIMAGLETANTDIAVLHYVGFGYQPNGIPLWMVEGLTAWKRRYRRRRLVVMFHELYAAGSVTKRSFWQQPWTRGIVRDLVRLADGWVTSCPAHEAKLLREFRADPARGLVIPIGSNIPASAPVDFHRAPAPGGKLNGVVFGLANTRLWALQKHRELLVALARDQRLQTITLLGKQEKSPTSLAEIAALRAALGPDVAWEERSNLDAAAISEILARQDFGLISNSPETLTKSGVFAALLLHGVIAIVPGEAGGAVPAALRDYVLVDEPGTIRLGPVVQSLEEPERSRRIRAGLENLAATQYSWGSIAGNWEKFLRRFES